MSLYPRVTTGQYLSLYRNRTLMSRLSRSVDGLSVGLTERADRQGSPSRLVDPDGRQRSSDIPEHCRRRGSLIVRDQSMSAGRLEVTEVELDHEHTSLN